MVNPIEFRILLRGRSNILLSTAAAFCYGCHLFPSLLYRLFYVIEHLHFEKHQAYLFSLI